MCLPRQPFRILFVCTGNMCRSPLAERLARARLAAAVEGRAEAVAVEVESAGTHGVTGAPVHPDTAEILRELGGDPEGFTARALTKEMVGAADLILTATRAHRDFVAATRPGAAARTFTILEFCALARAVRPAAIARAADAGARARALTAAVAALRDGMNHRPSGGTGRHPGASRLDIPDPVGRPMAVQRATAAAIAQALDVPLGLIAGAPLRFPRGGPP